MAERLIYLIAGEQSGDLLGARLMEALKKRTGYHVRFAGVGGPKMIEEGLNSLFPMKDISLFGIAEILPHLPRLLWRMRQTVNDIIAQQPGCVVTIDVPGFNLHIIQKLRKKTGRSIPVIGYVAPTVWAYRAERAKLVAELYDHLMVLLPFEPPYFEKEGLATTFVGHPITWEWKNMPDGAAFRTKHGIPEEIPLLCMLPGSRQGEIKRHLPVFEETLKLLYTDMREIMVVMPVPEAVAESVRKRVAHWPVRVVVVTQEQERKMALAASTVALAKSGTVTLEVALARVPMVVTYRIHPLSAWLVSRMLRTRFVNLINIMLQREAIPEFLQEKCRPDLLAEALRNLILYDALRQQQIDDAASVLADLGLDNPVSPSERAARVITNLMGNKR